MPLNKLNLDQFNPYFTTINEALYEVFNSRVPLVEEVGKYAVLGSGKRLRPLIFILCCELCGYTKKNVYELSTIFEYIHVASLLHDDVLDNADTRRKRASANQLWGNQAAVLEGDFLFAKALSVAVRADNIPFLTKLTEAAVQMTEGQILELAHVKDCHITRDQYMKIITAKTASLISGACACGAIIAQAPRQLETALTQFGLNIGIAFQLIDDLLDYTASEAEFGKPVGKDLREGKITLPLIYTLSQLNTAQTKNLMDKCLQNGAEDKDVEAVIQQVRTNGALDKTWEDAGAYAAQAGEHLHVFPESPIKTKLRKLGRYIIERRY